MSDPTFADCFCAKYQVSRDKYARAVFNRVLYKRTHLFRVFLTLFNRHYFAADFDLIYSVEQLQRARDFVTEVERFNEHPANRGTLRRVFGLRVSTSRLKTLIRETLPARSRSSGFSRVESVSVVDRDSSVPFDAESVHHHASTQYSS